MISDSLMERVRIALAADPRRRKDRPRALDDGECALRWLGELYPQAEDAVVLASLLHHLGRHEVERGSFAPGRQGYRAWKQAAARHTAHRAEEVLGDQVPDDERRAVLALLKRDRDAPGAQAFRDVVVLTFFQCDAEAFLHSQTPAASARAVSRTLAGLSQRGRESLNSELIPQPIRAVLAAQVDSMER